MQAPRHKIRKPFFRIAMRLAWRDALKSRSKFLLIILAVGIAVAVVTSILDLSQGVRRELILGARQWLAGDIQVRTNRPPSEERMQALHRLGWDATVVIETAGQISTPGGSHFEIAGIKAVDPASYPFYGEVRIAPHVSLNRAVSEDSAIVSPEILEKLQTSVGRTILVAGAEFTIAGTIEMEPDRFAIMPLALMHVMVTREGLDRTGMVEKGSSAIYRVLIRLPQGASVDQASRQVKQVFPLEESVNYEKNAAEVAGIEEQAATYFSFVAFMVLVVAALGAGLLMSSHIEQRMDMIAVMKMLGGSTGQFVQIFLLQISVMAIIGAVLGLLAGAGIERIFPLLVGSYLPFPEHLYPSWTAAIEGLCAGVAIPVLLAGVPIFSVRFIRPHRLIRRQAEPMKAFGLANMIILGLVIAGCAAASSGSRMNAVWIMICGLVSGLAICGCAMLAMKRVIRLALSIFAKRLSPLIRYGALNLVRQGSAAVPVVMALCLGVCFVYLAFLMERSLFSQVMQYSPFTQAQIYVLNVGLAQKEDVLDFLNRQGGVQRAELDPFVTLRLLAVNGNSTSAEMNRTWFAAVTRSKPSSLEISEGRWWADTDSSSAIALSARVARAMGARVGDLLTFSNGPELVNTRVAAIHRSSKAEALRYQLTLSPGSVSDARVTYNGAVWAATSRIDDLEAALRRQYTSALILNQAEIAAVMQDTAGEVASVLGFVSAVSLSGGAIILAASLCAMKLARKQEVSILKTLGATRGKVALSLAAEFTVLGLFASVVGVAIASGFQMLLGRFVFDPPLPSFSSWSAALATLVATMTVTNVAGWLAGASLLWQKPIEILRASD